MTNRIVSLVLRGDISGLRSSLTAANSSIRATVNRITDASRESQVWRQNMSALGDTAGKVGLVAAGGVAVAVRAFANFDQAMSNVAATGEDARGSIAELRKAAIDFGASTQFSATEAAGAIENLAKAGVSASDILGGGLKGSLDLAAAGQLDVAEAAEYASIAMTQFGLAGTDVPHIADLLAAGAGKANGEVADLASALNQAGLVADQTGLSIEETTAGLAAFASAGLLGSDSGTSFKTMLQALTPSSEAAKSAIEKYNISAYDAQGNFIGLEKFAGKLKDGLSGLTVEQRNATLKTVYGSDAIRAASVLYEQGADGIANWTKQVNDQGYAAETAAIKMDNLKGDIEQLGGALETALIGTGEGANGPLRETVQLLTNVVNGYSKLPAPIQSTALSMLGITAVLGGGLWFTAKTLAGVAQMRANLLALGPAGTRAAAGLRAAGTAAAVFAAVDLGASLAETLDDRSSGEVDKLSKSLLHLADTGKATGDLKDLFGADLGGRARSFNKDLKSLGDVLKNFNDYADDSPLTEGFKYVKSGGNGGIYAQVEAIQNLDESLSRLSKNNPKEAARAFEEVTKRAKETGASAADIAEAFPLMSSSMDAASASGDKAADSIGATGDAAAEAEVEVKSYSDALKGLLDPLISQDAAANAWKDALASLTDDLKKNGATLDDNSVKGRANQNAIRDRVSALKDSIAADEEAGVGQDQLSSKLLRGARRILDAGTAAGISKDKMRDYLHQLGLTPTQIKTIITAKTEDAVAALTDVQRVLRSIRDKTVYVNVKKGKHVNPGDFGGGTQLANANGSIVDYFADGGFSENHVAQIAPAGAMRVWAEPETGGEAYIPFAQSKKKRSQQIAMQTVARLGGTASFANGGTSGVDTIDLNSTGLSASIGAAVARETRKALYGTTFYMNPDGSIRAREMGA